MKPGRLADQELELGEETFRCQLRRPGPPGPPAIDIDERIPGNRLERYAQNVAHFLLGPADHADCFCGGSDAVRFLVNAPFLLRPGRQAIADGYGTFKLSNELAIGLAEEGLQDRDTIKS